MAASKAFEYTCTLHEETLEVAKNELNEDPSTRLLEIKTLRDRLEQYPGLKARLDPQFLLRFLRARKFDQERAFELVLNYYRMRKEESIIFVGLKPSDVAHVYERKLAYPHTHRDKLGRQIYCIFPARIDRSRYSMNDVFKVEFLNLNKLIEEEETQVRGFTLLVDYKDYGMSDLLQMETTFVRRISKIWADTFPGRMKLCLMVNEPHFVDMIVALFTPFAKEKHVKRIIRCGTDWKKVHGYIDPACLPARYGGTLEDGEACAETWTEQLLRCDREIEEEGKYGFVDYTLNPKGDQKQEDAFTNMAGTFKKLDT